MTNKPSVILFDVNETLMDMKPLKQKINRLLGNRGFRIFSCCNKFSRQAHVFYSQAVNISTNIS